MAISLNENIEEQLSGNVHFRVEKTQPENEILSRYNTEIQTLDIPYLGDSSGEVQKVLDRVSNQPQTDDHIPLDEALLVLTEACRSHLEGGVNRMLLEPATIIDTIRSALKKIELDAPEQNTILSSLVNFFDQYARAGVRFGYPVSWKMDEFKEKLESTLADDDISTIVIKKIVDSVYLPILDKMKLDAGYLNGMIINAKSNLEAGQKPLLEQKRRLINPEIGSQFFGHGLNLGPAEDLRNLISFLTLGPDPHRLPLNEVVLRQTDELENGTHGPAGAPYPYTEGGFIMVSYPGKELNTLGVRAVLVNPHFYDAIPDLEKKFSPPITFIKADDLPDKFDQLVAST